MLTPVLTTKLYIPPVRPSLVSRPRLIERMSGGMHRQLTLISAPAGFGKTTLLGECAARCGLLVAWFSLDESDNDPARFLAYLIAALQSIEADIGKEALSALDAAQAPPIASLLVGLINQLAAVPAPFVLVLDDYHLIGARPIHDALTFLLNHQPPQMHLVISTRADPPLPLARLRARGELAELRQNDLRFTTEEAAAFLNKIMGLSLSAEHVAALETRTEGWIAGLQMAALSLQGHSQDPAARSEFVQAFTGSHRFVLDYLVGEVLELQPAAIQEFLLKTSILERLTGPLCDAVAGSQRTGDPATATAPVMAGYSVSQSILEQLETANLFVVPLDDDRSWYRYHRLFADLLRKRLAHTSPDLVPALHRRASEWHEQQGLMAPAIDHALAAHDFERAARLIEGSVEATLMRSEITTFLNWVGRLPDEWVRSRPTLCFFHAWALLMSGRSPDVVEQRLQDVASVQEAVESSGAMAGRMAALRAYLMLFQADTLRAAELCQQAMETLPANDRFLRSIVAWILSVARLANGSLEDGSQALQEVARMSQEMGNPLIAVAALCHQAKLQMRQGRLHTAQETLQRALHLATDAQGRRLPIACKALIGLGELKREWNDLKAAADDLAESIELAKQWSELLAFDAYFPLMRTRLAQGDVGAAREALETARQIAGRSETTEIDDSVADLQQAQFLISQGDFEGAMRWAERRGLAAGLSSEPRPGLERQDLIAARMRKYELLVLARLFICQDRPSEALELLESLLVQARQWGRIDLIVQSQILRALACQAEGRDAQAIDALVEALSLAEPGGYMRILLDEGEPMVRLLRRAAARGVAPAYVAKLLAAFGSESAKAALPQTRSLVEPLSERELVVLRLLAGGLSNPEIAGELVIAASTVHSHCKSIFGKLGVHNRWDAVQRARELGIIE
jgi:LuxR family maltose regulon positive regulatory protein